MKRGKYSFEEVEIEIEKRGFKLLQDFYIDCITKMSVICLCGHLTEKTFSSITRGCILLPQSKLKPQLTDSERLLIIKNSCPKFHIQKRK